LTKPKGAFSFTETSKGLTELLVDHGFASLGDAYVNFIGSLVLSNKVGKPSGMKIKGSVLAEAVRKAGLRECLPSRMSRHALADAAEALIVYGWLNGLVTVGESVRIVGKDGDMTEGFAQLLLTTKRRATFP
jgi:hypothetical protein